MGEQLYIMVDYGKDSDGREIRAFERVFKTEEYIEKLEAELARLREAARWIPVGEKLPDTVDPVLMWYFYGISRVGTYGDGEWRNSENYYIAPDEITHWRPLPEPPEEVK